MNGQFPPYVIALVLAVVLAALLAHAAWRRRDLPVARALGWLMLAAAIWAAGRALEALASPAPAKIFWAKVQYLGIVAAPAVWLIFALRYSRLERWFTRGHRLLLWFVPGLTLALVWTNERHGLIWSAITPGPTPDRLIYAHGPVFWLAVVYNYLLVLIGAGLIVRVAWGGPPALRRPAVLMAAAAALPLLGNGLYLIGYSPLPGVDLAPLSFPAAGALMALGIFRLQFFDLLPLARAAVVDRIRDGVLVVDAAARVLDLNPAARRLLALADASPLGRPVETVLAVWPDLLARYTSGAEAQVELSVGGFELEARLSALAEAGAGPAGWLVMLRDVTIRKQTAAALQQSEARLRQVIDLVPHLIFAKDADGRYVLVNQAMAAAYGATPETLLGRRDVEFARSPAEAEAFRRDDLEVMTTGQPKLIPEEPLTGPGGEVRFFQTTKIPFALSGAPGMAMLGVATDITERKRAEAALRESEQRFRALIEASPVPIALTRDERFVYVNPAYLQMTGFAALSEVAGHSIYDHLAPELGADGAVPPTAGSARGPVLEYEAVGLRRDGARFPCHITLAQVELGDGPVGLLFAQDITARKQAEAAVRESERRYRLLAENATDVIWTMDFSGRFTYISPSVEPLRGFTPDEVLRQPLAEAVTPDSLALMLDLLQAAVRELTLGEPMPARPHEVEQPRKDGTTVWTEVIARVMYDAGGAPTGILGVSRDITARKQLEAENRRLFEAAQRRAMEAETLREAGAAVAATLDRDDLIRRLLEQLKRVVPYDSASVQLLRDEEMEIVGGSGFADLSAVIGMRFKMSAATPDLVVFQTRQPHILHDAQADYAAFREPPHNHIHGWLGVPLIVQDRVIGMLALDSTRPGAFTGDHARLATAFADQVAIALENARLFEDVQRLAITDALTGVYNRRHFFHLAALEFELACRYRHALSVIMLDIDHFKAVNDAFGHAAGDHVLRHVAQLCRTALRKPDLIGRYGGEEFVILLPETSPDSAVQVAERLRALIEATPFDAHAHAPARITLSLGVATLPLADCRDQPAPDSLQKLVDWADRGLYAAKQSGRNCVRVGGPADPV